MKCYHVTTKDRLWSILCEGLRPNSKPNWFKSRTPYVMLSLRPYFTIYDESEEVFLEINDPAIKREYFDDPEGLRWDKPIKPKYIKIMSIFDILVHKLADLREKSQNEKGISGVIEGTRKEYIAKRNGYIEGVQHSINEIVKLKEIWC